MVKAIHSKPKLEDLDVLLRGLRSFDLSVNKASLIGLRKIELKMPLKDSKELEEVFRLEGKLGWTNPEISIRDQIVLLLQKWIGEDFPQMGYEIRKYDMAGEHLKSQQKAISEAMNSIGRTFSIRTKDMDSDAAIAAALSRIEKIDFSTGDVTRGAQAYKKFQCTACHSGGGQNSGPSLAGVASRFSRDDVFQAIVNPNDNVPDRYRAVVVATEDGQLFKGSVVYQSKAGVMLATGSGEVVRIAADEIESRRKTDNSLMPEGLLDQADDQEIADLWAYLKNL